MIYFARCREFVKIGFTGGSVKSRLGELQVGNPEKIELLAVVDGSQREEQKLHKRFKEFRIRGEWFRLELIELMLTMAIEGLTTYRGVDRRLRSPGMHDIREDEKFFLEHPEVSVHLYDTYVKGSCDP